MKQILFLFLTIMPFLPASAEMYRADKSKEVVVCDIGYITYIDVVSEQAEPILFLNRHGININSRNYLINMLKKKQKCLYVYNCSLVFYEPKAKRTININPNTYYNNILITGIRYFEQENHLKAPKVYLSEKYSDHYYRSYLIGSNLNNKLNFNKNNIIKPLC